MRTLITLALTFFLSVSCTTLCKKDINNSQIVYEANTKGYYGKVIVENRMVSVSKQRGNGDLKTKKLSNADWKVLSKELKKINLEGMSKLEAPSKARFYDGAATADVTVKTKGKTYQSSPFDHKNPPAEIKNFVNKLVSFLDEN